MVAVCGEWGEWWFWFGESFFLRRCASLPSRCMGRSRTAPTGCGSFADRGGGCLPYPALLSAPVTLTLALSRRAGEGIPLPPLPSVLHPPLHIASLGFVRGPPYAEAKGVRAGRRPRPCRPLRAPFVLRTFPPRAGETWPSGPPLGSRVRIAVRGRLRGDGGLDGDVHEGFGGCGGEG